MKVGEQFGRWVVLKRISSIKYLVRCSCGTEKEVWYSNLTSGVSRSCGCLRSEFNLHTKTKHGMSHTPEYRAWRGIWDRCLNPKNSSYQYYGARGITVCREWKLFENFLKDMGRRPSRSHSIERKKNNLGYHPKNCKWALPAEQNLNKRNVVLVRWDGKEVPMVLVARRLGIGISVVRNRIHYGWSLDRALKTPVRKKITYFKGDS